MASQPAISHFDVVIIGTGFGGSMTGLTLAERTQDMGAKILMLERGTWWTTPVSTVQDKEVGMPDFLRRHDQPVQFWSAQNDFKGFLDLITRCFRRTRESSLFARLFASFRNEDGLIETDWFGRRSLFGRHSDGIMVARSCGVGGGSLIYSNVTIRPPNFVLDGPRWPKGIWSDDPASAEAHRHYYYQFAREAIGVGVVHSLRVRETNGKSAVTAAHPDRVSGTIVDFTPGTSIKVDHVLGQPPGTEMVFLADSSLTADIQQDLRPGTPIWIDPKPGSSPPSALRIIVQGGLKVNTGLSNILARTARLSPFYPNASPLQPGDDFNPRGVIGLPAIDPKPPLPPGSEDPQHALWINRARAFHGAVREMTTDYGAADMSINDLAADDHPLATGGKAKNYCERQGRCNIGCLPGARHTLNKQLVRAAVGVFRPGNTDLAQDFPNLQVQGLTEVDSIRALDGGGYAIDVDQQTIENYRAQEEGKARRQVERRTVTADIVIVAAGTLGTTEILLRSKSRGGLAGLSEKLGYGFSANGDYIAFMAPTDKWLSLIKGPMTTSFAHFETERNGTGEGGPAGPAGDPARFHTIEDQGVPPSMATLIGEGVRVIQTLGKGNTGYFLVVYSIWRYAMKWLRNAIRDLFRNSIRRGDLFKSDDELSARMMAVAVMGRDEANATIRLGTGSGDSPLRISKPGGSRFSDDPIHAVQRSTLDRLAKKLGDPKSAEFIHPLLNPTGKALKVDAIATSHPLGGCIMAEDATGGAVNAHGQPFDTSDKSSTAVYPGLYVADGSIVPSALGVNPSLTISALALRIGDKIFETHFAGGGV